MEQDTISMTIEQKDKSLVRVTLSGRLDNCTVPNLWSTCLKLQSDYQPKQLHVDVSQLNYCDDAGIALLQMLEKKQKNIQQAFHINGLTEHLQHLMTGIKQPPVVSPKRRKRRASVKELMIHTTKGVLANIHDNTVFLGILIIQSLQVITQRKGIRWKDFWLALEDVGPKALPIIVLIGFLIGLISTFQAARPMGQFGAQIFIINLVGLGLTREMGPLMTAVLLAGRTASSFAAEIGTMKINQEVDALRTMGLSPIKFLTLPRILATAIMTPILNVFLILAGLVGSAIVMHSLGYNGHLFLNQLEKTVRLRDFIGGTIKAFVFGLVIASTGCLHGLKTKMGPSAVGQSTTQAVVSSLILIVIVDGLFASIYYLLGV